MPKALAKLTDIEKDDTIIVLGIDPGYERVGIAFISHQKTGKPVLLFSTCLRTEKSKILSHRIAQIADELNILIEKFKPDMLAIEHLFFTSNQKTAIAVAQAKGVMIYIAHKHGCTIEEFSPVEIKVAVAGHGRATKQEILTMVPHLIIGDIKNKIDDEIDAIAIALTGLAYRAYRARA